MKSICIKFVNQNSAEYLLEKLNNSKIDDIYFSYKKFKTYYNVIIHFKGKNITYFTQEISQILSFFIIDMYEKLIIDNLIKSEYFYFENTERKKIANITYEDLYDNEETLCSPAERFNILYTSLYNYLTPNHSLIFKGFITFRIRKYYETILEQIDKSVNKYIIEKEYTEFISLLRIYVNSENSSCDTIHLIYYNSKSILIDENNTVINIEKSMANIKYLSDITFSNNDYTLNTLLNIIPKKIIVHLLDENVDEFINTIKLIFEDRVSFCNNCSVCKTYKKSHIIQS